MKVSELRVGLLFYFVGTEHIYVNVLSQTGERHLTRLATVEQIWPSVDQLVKVLQQPLRCSQSEVVETLQRFSGEWGKLLLPPVESLENFDVLVIVPHHFLHYLPFHLVSLGHGSQYVGTRFGISYCSSATLFTRAVERNIARRQTGSEWEFSLLKPVPDCAATTPRKCVSLGVDIVGQNDREYNQLARDCASYFREGRYLDLGRLGLKQSLNECADVICLVCHGYADTFVSDKSGLLLRSPSDTMGEMTILLHDGSPYRFRDLPLSYVPPHIQPAKCHTGLEEAELMTVGEVKIFVGTATQLVMLLGCSTGAGQILSGDMFGSLAYQWLAAGAASVLAHAWEADLRFVSEWMPVFTDNWISKRQPKAIAVRESLKKLVGKSQNPDETLNLWGAITLLGDWL